MRKAEKNWGGQHPAIRVDGEAFVMTFSTDEDREKGEIRGTLEQCEDFSKEIDKETASQYFAFAEIEENEEELDKLKKWYKKIIVRDTFGSPLREKAELMLPKCAELLDGFCDKVYKFNNKL